MGTKNKPGDYDCYAKLADDEPYFLLRAKDPHAPALVELWASLRAAEFGEYRKLDEARAVAKAMREWRREKTGSLMAAAGMPAPSVAVEQPAPLVEAVECHEFLCLPERAPSHYIGLRHRPLLSRAEQESLEADVPGQSSVTSIWPVD